MRRPDDAVWVGRDMVAIQSDKTSQMHAKRLLCLPGATSLPFTLSMELGDELRQRNYAKTIAVDDRGGGCPQLAGSIGRQYPYLVEVAADNTIDALLAEPVKKDEIIDGWIDRTEENRAKHLGVKDIRLLRKFGPAGKHQFIQTKSTIAQVLAACGNASVEDFIASCARRPSGMRNRWPGRSIGRLACLCRHAYALCATSTR